MLFFLGVILPLGVYVGAWLVFEFFDVRNVYLEDRKP